MCPSERLSHKFSRIPLSAHTQVLGSGEIFASPTGSWTRSAAYFDGFAGSSSHAIVFCCSSPKHDDLAISAFAAWITISGSSGLGSATLAFCGITTSACSFTISHFSTSTAKPPSPPIAIFVGAAASAAAAGGASLATRVCLKCTYSRLPVFSWSSATCSAPKPWKLVSETYSPSAESGVSKDSMHSSLYTASYAEATLGGFSRIAARTRSREEASAAGAGAAGAPPVIMSALNI